MPNVLYFDQDAHYGRYMKSVLPTYGIQCRSFENYPLALQELSQQQYDCIICEWSIPFPDNTESMRLLTKSINGTPLIIVTTTSKEDILPFAIDAGAGSVLSKPFSAQELANTITHLTWSRRHQKLHAV